ALMENLERRAELFAALNDVEHEYWLENSEAKKYVRELLLFKVKQMTPLLFAAFEMLSQADFVRVLRLVSVISFRYTIISGLNTNDLEPVYHRAAKALLTKQVSTPGQVFDQLRNIYVPDDRFIGNFTEIEIDTGGQRKRLAKYILCRLETDQSGVSRDYEADTGTIEHILPENAAAEWDTLFLPDRQKDFVYRLGNLTLLEGKLNRDIGNGLLQ
ncbi:MAG TPA: HNH endonuclease family protein, partial [Burkholderiales bacterium]|nr:HNH endonuclease family protein [Burkholderiales bacterium]